MQKTLSKCEAVSYEVPIGNLPGTRLSEIWLHLHDINHIDEIRYLIDCGFNVNCTVGGHVICSADVEDNHQRPYAIGRLLFDELEIIANENAGLMDYLDYHNPSGQNIYYDLKEYWTSAAPPTIGQALYCLLESLKLNEVEAERLKCDRGEETSLRRHPDELKHVREVIVHPFEGDQI